MQIRSAGIRDTHAVALTIAEATADLGLGTWLVPDDDARVRVLYAAARIHVDYAIRHGEVSIAGSACDAVAVWRRSSRLGRPQLIPYFNQRLGLACGPYLNRFLLLRRVLARRVPDGLHERLEFLATVSAFRRAGHASGLLVHMHERLDQAGVPAHTVAVDSESRRLLQRHGYVEDHGPVDLPDGPRLWSMARLPHQGPSISRHRDGRR